MPTTHRQGTEATENTMLSSTLISPAVGSPAAIVGTPPTAQRSTGDGSFAPESFARALNQAGSPPPSPAPSPPPSEREATRSDLASADTASADNRASMAADSATAARAAAQRKTAAVAANAVDEKSGASGSSTAPATAETGAGAGALATPAQDDPGTDHAGHPGDAAPDASSLLAALVAGTPAAAARAAGKSGLQSAGAAGVAAAPGPSRSAAAPAVDAAAAVAAGASRRGEAATDALAVAGERDATSRSAAAAASAAPTTTALPAAATPLHAPPPGLSAVAAGTGAPTVAEARLQASPGSAEFAPALGAQLNVFLRDGVQHARLHLHPVELGPLTVQIQLDGASAQVRLAAEHPLTRQALEQAMPTLAGTLREAGLTLTGGGVFEQPANPQAQQDGRTPAGRRDARDAPAPAETVPLRAAIARRGVVDLVA